MSDDAALHELIAESGFGVLTTIKRDGRPQLSNVSFTYDLGTGVIRVSTTDGRAKTANMRRDPRVSMLSQGEDRWSYAVAEGIADLSPVAGAPDDATVDELVEIYQAIGGEHSDWDDYRRAMVRDRRLVLRIPVDRVYGMTH